MQKIIFGTLFTVIVFSGVSALAQNNARVQVQDGVVCTMEVKICADGTGVGRTGPNCEFAKCPSAERSTGAIQKIKSLFQVRNEKTVEMRNGTTVEARQVVQNRAQERVASSTLQRAERYFELISIKYLRLLEREEAILLKISSRIEKIKLAGGETLEAENLVAEARTHLTQARESYEAFRLYGVEADNSTTLANEAIVNLKNSGKKAENHLREAHRVMIKTVGVLRGVSQLKNMGPESN